MAFAVNLKAQYSVGSPIVVNSFPHTESSVNTSDGVSASGMQGSCNTIPCCSVYVYKVTIPTAGSLRAEFSINTSLSNSIIGYSTTVPNPTSFSDIEYYSGPGNFCGFRDTMLIGRGYSWNSASPSYHDTSLAAPAGDYYILVFTENQQSSLGIGNSPDLTFQFAPATPGPASEEICYNTLPSTMSSSSAPSGGSGSYTYQWQTSADGSTGWTAAPGKNDSIAYVPSVPLTSTTYFRREVTDATCSSTAYSNVKQIVVGTELLATAVVDSNVSCNGDHDGGATVSASGGSTPYTYAWSNGATTASISGVFAGSYSVTITDNQGCTAEATATITENSTLALTAQKADISCYGSDDGSVDITISGGQTPYTYLWSNSATTEDLSGLSSGTYTVMVTDGNGCTSTSSSTVNEPESLSGGEVGN